MGGKQGKKRKLCTSVLLAARFPNAKKQKEGAECLVCQLLNYRNDKTK